ncbi:MAG: hypothetical protein ABJG78_12475 [Cyclobacteriaceae bacterium]
MKEVFVLILLILLTGCETKKQEEYYQNGNVKASYPIFDGEVNGTAFQYYEDGKVKQKSSWIKGKKNGPTTSYYRNGNVMLEASFIDGMQNGVVLKYDSLGWLEGKTHYVNNIPEGSFETYFENGEVKSMGEYFDEGKSSKTYYFYFNGRPNAYEVKKGDTLFYQKWHKEDGSFGGTYLPLSITLDDSFCIKLLHSQVPSDSLAVRVYFQKIGKGVLYNNTNIAESEGFEVCASELKIGDDNIIEGYLCEIFTGDGTNYGCMPFKYDARKKKMISITSPITS